MEHNKDIQAAFMDALNALKEYAKVNGNIVGKEDVAGFFKDMSLDDNKYSMITGYLMANGITIKGEDGTDNEFLHMLESTVDDSVKNDEKGIALENEYKSTEDDAFTEKQVTDKDGLITKINISEEEVKSLPEKEAAMAAQMIADNMDYSEDDIYIERYKKELEAIQPVSDTTRAYLLVNIVEDNDKESLKILSESYLEKILEWVEPYRCKGVLAADLVQESNLSMMAYIGQKLWLNNYEWKDRIKEGSTSDILEVLKDHTLMEKECKEILKKHDAKQIELLKIILKNKLKYQSYPFKLELCCYENELFYQVFYKKKRYDDLMKERFAALFPSAS